MGDGIDYDGINAVCKVTCEAGFCVSNLVFGMGGGLLQKINRDTQRFAFKSSAQKIVGEDWRDIFKDPIEGGKSSKRGRLVLLKDEAGEYYTDKLVGEDDPNDKLVPVFRNGELLVEYDFNEVVENSNK